MTGVSFLSVTKFVPSFWFLFSCCSGAELWFFCFVQLAVLERNHEFSLWVLRCNWAGVIQSWVCEEMEEAGVSCVMPSTLCRFVIVTVWLESVSCFLTFLSWTVKEDWEFNINVRSLHPVSTLWKYDCCRSDPLQVGTSSGFCEDEPDCYFPCEIDFARKASFRLPY